MFQWPSLQFLLLSSYFHSLYAASHFLLTLIVSPSLASLLSPSPWRQPRDGDCADMSSPCLLAVAEKKIPFVRYISPQLSSAFFPSYNCILSVLFVYIYHFIFPIPEYCSPTVLKGLKDSKCPLPILYLVFCRPLCCGFIFFQNVPSH